MKIISKALVEGVKYVVVGDKLILKKELQKEVLSKPS